MSLQVDRKQEVRDVNISVTEPLMPPAELLSELPLEGKARETVLLGRKGIQDILDGSDDRFFVIAGPCSIHDYDAALEYAGRLGALADRNSDRMLMAMRVYFEKPRTTVGWKGAIYDPHLDDSFDITTGLRRARSLLLEVARMGIFAATEFLDPIVPQYTADLVSWAAIGARTAESQTHRQMASGLSMPVGFKNGTGGSVQLAVDAVVAAQATHGFLGIDMNGRASAVQTKGNPYTHTVLRGGSDGSPTTTLPPWRTRSKGSSLTPAFHPDSWWTAATQNCAQGLHQDAGCLHRCCGAAGGRKRGSCRLHAGEQHQSRQPEAKWRCGRPGVRCFNHRSLHRLG